MGSSFRLTTACAAALSLPLLASSSPVSRNHSTTPFDWDETKYVIAFGDSYTYAQGTLGYANSTFIGSNLNISFTPQQLLSDRIQQEDVDSTANRGPNWIEDITQCGTKEGLTDPRTCPVQLWDFAFGGADITVEYLPLHHNWSVQLVNQTAQFLDYGQPVLKDFVDADKTLVAVWIGINDIGDSDELAVDFPTFYDEDITAMFEQSITPVYNAGYKKWLFMNLPPLNRSPPNLVRAAGPLPNATMIDWWDESLQSHADAFAAAHEDASVMIFDANTFLNGVLDNATEYGFTNTTGYCPEYDQPLPVEQYGCLPLYDYFWYNTGHLTTHTHSVIAAELEKFLKAWSK
ncbi:lysophospholipase A [Coniella lustricola]|uniref:Lysophospholipase A n=1 Tax=Coniella lustricola TaxID=2025994 RepID=A0A2T3A4V3_9PEZI|nr:lysophospholipase A [Coniella lustricola]